MYSVIFSQAINSLFPDVFFTEIDRYLSSFKIFSFLSNLVLVASIQASIIAALDLFIPPNGLQFSEYKILHLKVGLFLSSEYLTTLTSS